MTATTTTLPLYWRLSSGNKSERLDASVKLVTALQQFHQERHISEPRPKESSPEIEAVDGENNEDLEYKSYSAKLDANNATDVAYAVRRLIRGLASPRESSRLGFAVALTELLSCLDTITCGQIIVLVRNASQTSGSMSGQEERDMLFARLFGLKSVIQSGLLFSQKPLRSSSTSSSSLKDFENLVEELLSLADKKSWLRESCWWSLVSAINVLSGSDVLWKEDAYNLLLDRIYVSDRSWGPEKIAITLRLQKMISAWDWQTHCGTYFKGSDILSTSNLSSLGRLLKESMSEEISGDETARHTTGPWKPQLHFVWDVILDTLLTAENSTTGNFQDFYRIVVDETLFANSSSVQRKYWGFLVFQKALQRVPSEHLPMLFTKNFMRTWINQLSKSDRYLHKIARQVTSDIQKVVEKDPKAGFTLVLQLTGTNGSFHFDRITKTKTVESIIGKMDSEGIRGYVDHLLKQVNTTQKTDSITSLDAQRSWIIDQMTVLIRKGIIPKTDESIQLVLDWLATHAFFTVIRKSSKSSNAALHFVPEPSFTDNLQKTCRAKLLSCLGDLTSMSSTTESGDNGKAVKLTGVNSDSEFWISKVLETIIMLESDVKHVLNILQLEDEKLGTRSQALSAIKQVKVATKTSEPARGAELLLNALALKCLCDDESEADWDGLRECTDIVLKLFVPGKEESKKKKKRKETNAQEGGEETENLPIDLIIDIIIGLLEQSSTFTRVIANQSFDMLTPLVTDTTADLILAQLERRDPYDEAIDEDVDEDIEMEVEGGELELKGVENDGDGDDDDESSSSSDEEDEDEGDEGQENEEAEALRKALQAAVSGKEANGVSDEPDESSDEASMDDEQMMAIDEKLAAVFRARADGRKRGKDVGAQREATYFKNRVLDLIETYMRRQSSSPLTLRFILPLVELVATASTDEKQLGDKAKGILRSRLSKARDPVTTNDESSAVELLESLHLRARKAHSQETVSMISLCSLFVTKALIVINEEAVLRIYKESVTDFITRKASSLNSTFIMDFIRRYPVPAWSMRSHATEAISLAFNGYRQSQAFSFVHTLVASLPQSDASKRELGSFLPAVSAAFLDALQKSCAAEKPLMNTTHMKEALEVTLKLCQASTRFATTPTVLEEAWTPSKWNELAIALSTSEAYKASTSLPRICKRIVGLVQIKAAKTAESPSNKRKKEADGEGERDGAPRKRKRKKVRKGPKGGIE